MNYSNSAQRLRPPKAHRPEEAETVLCVETDKRGTHLRLRKVATLARRALRPMGIAAAACWLVAGTAARGATYVVIEQSAGLFTPSFRDVGPGSNDANNTTYYAWTGNIDGVGGSADDFGFDTAVDGAGALDPFGSTDMRIVNPPAIRGRGGLDGSINQNDLGINILSGSSSIFAGDGTNSSLTVHLTLQIATNGVAGTDGFTTIIIQGTGSLVGGGTQPPPQFGPITLGLDTYNPEFVYSHNTAAGGTRIQWFARYILPGNQTSYTIDMSTLSGPTFNPTSVRELSVDTYWGPAPDTNEVVLVPEPKAFASLLGGCGIFSMLRRRRSR
jgi:hypothetical protein